MQIRDITAGSTVSALAGPRRDDPAGSAAVPAVGEFGRAGTGDSDYGTPTGRRIEIANSLDGATVEPLRELP